MMAASEKKPTKADQIRAVIAQLYAGSKPVTPAIVIETLAAQGVKVASSQASSLLAQYNQRRRSGRAVEANGAPEPQAAAPDHSRIMAAARFARECGGLVAAQQTLAILGEIVGQFDVA